MSWCVLFFFFFNHKTAYEVRISDWSSDVCSSDLRIPRSTGMPMLFQLAEKDDYTPAALCQTYAAKFRELGNERVVVKLYEGAHHGWEAIGPLHELRRGRKSVVEGRRVAVRVDVGGGRSIRKKTTNTATNVG